MAKAMTGSFYLTETVTLAAGLAAGGRAGSTIDLGAYVNVATGQAVAIESVDFIYQTGTDYGQAGIDMLDQSGAISVQLSDLNPNTVLLRADDHSLIASGGLNISLDDHLNNRTMNILSHQADLYPDNFGPANLSESFLVVNDTLYLVAGPDHSAIGTEAVVVTARIRCRVAKLSSKDWMAIAIQSTASDN